MNQQRQDYQDGQPADHPADALKHAECYPSIVGGLKGKKLVDFKRPGADKVFGRPPLGEAVGGEGQDDEDIWKHNKKVDWLIG